MAYLKGSDDKTSKEEVEKMIARYEAGVKKARKVTKMETNMNGMGITAEKGGRVKMCEIITEFLTQRFKAEIDARQIELPKDFKKMTMKERRDILQRDELKERAAMGLAREGLRQEDISDIIPISEEMKALILILAERWARK